MSKKQGHSIKYYPVFLDLRNRRCSVVGGGRVAERKTRQLLDAGADVCIISPDLTEGLRRMLAAGKIKQKKQRYTVGDARNAFLIIAATSNETVSKKILADADGLINVVDMPDRGSFIMPSVIRSGPLTIAVSTSGISPSLSKTLRKELEDHIPDELPQYLSYLKKTRQLVLRSFPRSSKKVVQKRAVILKKLGSPKVLGFLRQRGFKYVKFYIDDMIKKNTPEQDRL